MQMPLRFAQMAPDQRGEVITFIGISSAYIPRKFHF